MKIEAAAPSLLVICDGNIRSPHSSPHWRAFCVIAVGCAETGAVHFKSGQADAEEEIDDSTMRECERILG